MKKTNEMLRHIPELDGVRGIAILMVMVMHFYDPVASQSPFGPFTRLIMNGGAGVDLFFVLSGFLITSILVSTRDATNYFRAFYARRALRIFPLYCSVVAIFFFLLVPFLQHHGKDMWIKPGEQVWYWLFLSNWRHALGYNDGAQLAHFWSLAIEEQFYLLWSVVVWFSPARKMKYISIAVIVAVVLGRTVAAHFGASPQFLYFSTVTRMDALAWGALLAVSPGFRQFIGKLAYILIPLSILLVLFDLPLQLTGLVYGVGSAALVGVAITRSVPPLRIAWLRSFGKYSYGLYVLHYLLHGALPVVVDRLGPLPFALISIPGGIALSYGAAWVSWKILEEPFLRLKGNFNYRFGSAERLASR